MGGADGPSWLPVDALPPSCKLVYKMLEWEGELTARALARETMLSTATIRYATERLEANGHIARRTGHPGCSETVYVLPSDGR
jgi:predicted transcriptional regulator